MEQTAVLVLFLAALLAFLAPAPRRVLASWFDRRPALLFLAPPALTILFAACATLAPVPSPSLILLVLVYTTAPVLCAFLQGPADVAIPSVLDFATILLLWLPIEFSAGANLVPRPAQGFLHGVAYGIAILLGLVIFLAFRRVPGMKYNLPAVPRDYWLPIAAFAVLAPILAAAGIAIGFIPFPHASSQPAGRMALTVPIILAATALPEEILFRSLIQNLLMLRFGPGARTLFAAAFIFGCAHLDNGPQPLPNWRYMILATIAGYAYGWVFQKASTVFSSATLHMLVDWTKHFFF